ncbi:TraB/GumN family protein [Evansella sp. AB-P1]|uniref:TraB/GumN family protein n=1 Tax=Evansella sp. AB-P1 TaxID=3037653 RepID=UPI00241E1A70|nr:TraB/GumN family protein [Evansella sp. AB-P1]MDG5786044.1 TraB/GumN family protein [Evansella sp. AB-P1]
MKKYYTFFFTILTFLILMGCTATNEAVNQEDITDDPSKGVFYKLEEGSNTVYLLGSIHIGMDELYPLHETIEEAFSGADYLAVEIDMTEINEMEVGQFMQEIGMYLDGRTLNSVVGDETFGELVSILEPHGYSAGILNMFKPFIVQDLLTMTAALEAGYDSDEGIDMYFMNQAVENDIEIIGLETYEDQLTISTILSEDTQVQQLEETVTNFDELNTEVEEMMNIWITGNIEALLEFREVDESAPEDYHEYMYALMDERDRKMAEKIEAFLLSDNEETYFVVVGAMHLVGDTSIVGLLEQQGYTVQEGIAY